MTQINIEHINVTVSDPDDSAELLCKLFGWKIRWAGDAIHNGRTVHVGTETSYIAFFTKSDVKGSKEDSYQTLAGLNHLGVVVDNLSDIEKKVTDEGLKPYNHGEYEPGKRFYFNTHDGLEIEVVSYI